MKNLKRLAVAMLVVAMILSTAGFAAAGASDIEGEPCEEAVEYLMALGIIAGYPDGTFQPARTLTRAEVAKIIVIAKLGAQGEQMAGYLKGALSFPDVPADHWASGYIMLAKNLGIVGGYPDGTYKPANNVTYAELIKMLVEAAGLEQGIGEWPTNYLAPAIAAGITGAIPGDWTAGAPATRGDMACMSSFTVQEVANPTTGQTLGQSVFGESAIATLTVTASATHVAIGAAVTLTSAAVDADGNVVVVAPTYMTSVPATSAVSSAGVFVGSASGVYTVTATADGKSATAEITVFGAATALKATAASATVPANGATTVAITVEVVDANGYRVANSTVEITIAHDEDNGAVTLPATVAKDAVAGVATFEVTATTLTEVTDILEFIAETDLDDATVEISTVDQVATSIELEADPTELMANEIDEGEVTATVLDQAGEPMESGVYDITFAITGKGTLEGGTAAKVITTIDAEAVADVASIKGDPGTFTITASATGLSSADVTVTSHIAGSPKALQVTTTDVAGEAQNVENDMEITITIVDQWGQPTVSDEDVVVVVDDDGDGAWAGSLADFTILAGNPRETIEWWGTEAGTFTITIEDDAGDLTATSFECTVVPGDPVELTITPDLADADVLLHISNPTMTVTAQLVDEFGNDVAKAGEEVEFDVSEIVVDANTGTAELNGETAPVDVETDSAGKATVTFTAQPYVGDAWEVTAAWDGNTVGTNDLTNAIVVVDSVPGTVTITTRNDADNKIGWIAADDGETVEVTIELEDSNGNLMGDDYLIEVTFSNDGENVQDVTDDTSNSFNPEGDGVYLITTDGGEVVFTFEGATKGSFTITAKALNAPGAVSASKGFTTKAGSVVVDAMIFNTDGTIADEVEFEENEPVELRVSVVDNGDNAIQVAVAATVDLASVGHTGEYRLSPTGVAVLEATIAAGRTFKTIYYVNADDTESPADLTGDAEPQSPTGALLSATTTTLVIQWSEAMDAGAGVVGNYVLTAGTATLDTASYDAATMRTTLTFSGDVLANGNVVTITTANVTNLNGLATTTATITVAGI